MDHGRTHGNQAGAFKGAGNNVNLTLQTVVCHWRHCALCRYRPWNAHRAAVYPMASCRRAGERCIRACGCGRFVVGPHQAALLAL